MDTISVETRLEKIDELSSEIYELSEQTNSLKSLALEYQDLDRNIIKTAEDQERLNQLLEEAGETLSEEEKGFYQLLTNDKKIDYLNKKIESNEREQEQKYYRQLEQMMGSSGVLQDPEAVAALYAIGNY